MRDFKQLKVWEKSHQLNLDVYKMAASFPREELFGLTSQIRRAAHSIPTNICEGCGRNTLAEFAQFLNVSMGSASELEYHLLVANDLGLISSAVYERLLTQVLEVKRMLGAYLQKVYADIRKEKVTPRSSRSKVGVSDF